MPDQTPEGMELTLRTLAMPADTNAAGDIFGGWVMSRWTWPRRSAPTSAEMAAP